MTADEVREEAIGGIDRVLSMGPMFGPSKKQRAVLEGCKRAILADPSLCEKIARLASPPGHAEGEAE